MEYHTFPLILIPLISTIIYLLKISTKPSKSNLPPGPKPWPIIGNIHLLGHKPHRSVSELSKKYGPIMTLKLGSVTTIVISSPKVAEEMFLKHDLALSGRKTPYAICVQDHDKYSMAFIPVSPKWRNLRKIATVQLLTNHRLDASQGLRREKVHELVQYARDCCEKGIAMDIGKAGFITSLNLLSNTFFSMNLTSYDSSFSGEFRDIVWNMLEEAGRPNLSDFFPVLKGLDLQGMRKRYSVYYYKMIAIFDEIINQRLKDSTSDKDDVLGSLLKLVKEDELSLDDVRHLLLDLFIAGTDTTSATLEWAMTELLVNPQKIEIAQKQISQVFAKDQVIHESDIPKLPYIHAVVKETFRMHPSVPFLLPHWAENDVQLSSYYVPKDAQIWVNVWSMGRDPSVWLDPNSFIPERFLDKDIDVKGRDFELLPFGAGRRICPGLPLAYRMVHLTLATLLHSFDWKLGNGMSQVWDHVAKISAAYGGPTLQMIR
uniref:Cytochrome P450 76AD18 n=1 Tax=Mollugo verticillata TaxID=3592 RepID=A0A0X9R8K4_MOLVE|nr:cytochrome P450 76AD18 [Mollugo verticillata]